MPSKATTEPATVPNKLVDKIVGQLDLNKINDSLAEALATKLLEPMDITKLADVLFQKHSAELQEELVKAIIARL